MSGYGLNYVYEHGSLGIKAQFKRLFRLYKTYWLVMLIFVPIGIFINPDRYPGTYVDLISNITGWNTTYNEEMWFLFPYILLAITSYFIFRLIDKTGNKVSFVTSIALYFASRFVISRYITPNELYHEQYVVVLRYFYLLLSFVIGALFYRIDLRSIICKLSSHPQISLLLLLFIFCLHFITNSERLNPFFDALIIFLFLQLKINKYFLSTLRELGDKSTFMWMVHTYFAYYLFHDFIYGFRYPFIIYFVLIIISYISASFLERLISMLEKSIIH